MICDYGIYSNNFLTILKGAIFLVILLMGGGCFVGVMLHSLIHYQQEHVLSTEPQKLQNYGEATCGAVTCASSVQIIHMHTQASFL